jgi:hypothetical protein
LAPLALPGSGSGSNSSYGESTPMPTLTPLQFSLHSLPDEVGSLFPLVQNRIHAVKRPGREPGRHLLVIYLFPAHFVDITY